MDETLIIDEMNIRDIYMSFMKLDNVGDDTNSNNAEKPKTNDTCINCNKNIIIDVYSQGIRVCSSCGVILDNIYDNNIDWKCGDGNNESKSIVIHNVLLPQSSMSTSIGGAWKSRVKTLHNWSLMPYKERSLYDVFKIIDSACHKLKILRCISDDTKIKFKMLSECKHQIGKNTGKSMITRGSNRSGLIVACLDNSCKKKGISKSSKEMAAVFGIKEKDITKGRKVYKKMMRIQKQTIESQNSPSSYVSRFCSGLKLSDELINLAIRFTVNIEKLYIATDHTPQSIALGSILLLKNTEKLSNITKNNFSKQFGISNITLTKVYSKLKKYNNIIKDDALTDKVINIISNKIHIIPDAIKKKMEFYNISTKNSNDAYVSSDKNTFDCYINNVRKVSDFQCVNFNKYKM